MPQPASHFDVDLKRILRALGNVSAETGQKVAYTVIPGNAGPRWMLPNQGELTQTILSEWRPYTNAARIYWTGLCMLARVGGLRLLPRTKQVMLPADLGKQLLCAIGAEADVPPPVIFIGSPTATHKIIVFVSGPDQSSRAVIKLPLADLARSSIRDEAEILRRLDGKFGAPRLLHYSHEAGSSMQEYLRGSTGSRRFKRQYLDLLLALAETSQTIALRSRMEFLRQRLESRPEYAAHADLVKAAFGYMDMDASVPAILVHGDFAPWNLRETGGGQVTLIDWELAEWEAMPLHDLSYFFYVQTRVFAPSTLFYTTMKTQGGCFDYCRGLGIEESLLPSLAAAFLLAMLARGWETGRNAASLFCLNQIEAFLASMKNGRGA